MNDQFDRLTKIRKTAKHQEMLSQLNYQAVVRECADIINQLDPNSRRPWLYQVLQEMYVNQGGICPLCGKLMELGEYEVDHIVPLALGGGNESSNIQLTHGRCNRKKGISINPDVLLRYLEDRYQNRKW